MPRFTTASVPPRLLAGIVLAGTLSVLDSTVVLPLLTTIGDDLKADTSESWIVAAYLLANTMTVPLWGRWMDLRGEHRTMWAALTVFGVFTTFAMLAPSIGWLIVARLGQGVGSGGIVPLGQAILAVRCTREERARLQIFYSVSYGLAAGIGPVVGGLLVDVSWRFAFGLVIPLVLVTALLLHGQLHRKPVTTTTPHLDVPGVVLVASTMAMLVIAVERQIWWMLIVGGFSAAITVTRARHRPEGVLPARVLNNRVVVAAALACLLLGFMQFSYLTYLPELSSTLSPELNSGLVVIPLTVLWLTLGAVAGVAAIRVGTRRIVMVASIAGGGAGLIVATSSALPPLFVAAALVGATVGMILVPLILIAQRWVGEADLGSATSILMLMRNFGGALGTAVTAVVLAGPGKSTAFIMLSVIGFAIALPGIVLPSRRNETPPWATVDTNG